MIALLCVIMLLSVQLLRYRIALRNERRDCDQVAEDYQDLGRMYWDETEELCGALHRIAETSTGPHVGIATKVLAKHASGELMSIYNPTSYAEWQAHIATSSATWGTQEAALEADEAAHPVRTYLRRQKRRLVWWWLNPIAFK